jgi:hypothetical protein
MNWAPRSLFGCPTLDTYLFLWLGWAGPTGRGRPVLAENLLSLVSGHDFSRADKPINKSGFSP